MSLEDNTSIDFLENIEENNIPYKSDDVSEDYVFGLEDLENLTTAPVKQGPMRNVKTLSPKPENSSAHSEVFDAFLSETDIRLKDVVDKVFSRSDRPFVVIRDDKIEYVNKTFFKLVELNSEQNVLHQKFLKFVAKEDWDFLAKNIGEMLTNNEAMEINLICGVHKTIKVKFEAIYLSDDQHFTFILIGERLGARTASVMSMYDQLTGLPNFYLFEDRVQVLVNYENYKDVRQKKNMIAVAGVAIDNFDDLKAIGMHEWVLKKLAEKLMLSLKKTYTVGSGLKYQFWILMPDIMDEESLKLELSKIQTIFQEPIADNFTAHELSASIGVSIFPEPAASAKKLIEQTILSIQKAQKEGGNRLQIFGI